MFLHPDCSVLGEWLLCQDLGFHPVSTVVSGYHKGWIHLEMRLHLHYLSLCHPCFHHTVHVLILYTGQLKKKTLERSSVEEFLLKPIRKILPNEGVSANSSLVAQNVLCWFIEQINPSKISLELLDRKEMSFLVKNTQGNGCRVEILLRVDLLRVVGV